MKDEKMVNAIIYILSFLFSPFLSLLLVITGIRRGIPTVKDVVFVIFCDWIYIHLLVSMG